MSSSTAQPSSRSPWAALHGVAMARVSPLDGPLDVEIRVPGSKSYTNRALIMAAVASGRSVLRGILRSDDSYWCVQTLARLGAAVEVDGDVATIAGVDGRWAASEGPLFIGSAGTTARFLPGVLAAASARDVSWVLDGSEQMRRRPVGPLFAALRALGAQIADLGEPGALPVRIAGSGLGGGEVTLSGSVSSQFISGVLIASPYARAPVTVRIADHIVQHAYVMMTIDMMRDFGVDVEHDPGLQRMHVSPQRYRGRDLPLEADASTAGYFFALAALSSGRVRVTNLGSATRQPDIKLLDVLARMGCAVDRGRDFVEVRGPARLRGGFTISLKELSDQTPTLAALAPFADGPITITDVAHIRHHESDRIAAVSGNLRALGVDCEEHPDGLTVRPGPLPALHGARLPSHDDHRIAMSMALIGTRVPGVEILDPGCVSKTCPTFFSELERLGVRVELG